MLPPARGSPLKFLGTSLGHWCRHSRRGMPHSGTAGPQGPRGFHSPLPRDRPDSPVSQVGVHTASLCHLRKRPRVHPPTTGCVGVVSKGAKALVNRMCSCRLSISEMPVPVCPSSYVVSFSQKDKDSRHTVSLLFLARIVDALDVFLSKPLPLPAVLTAFDFPPQQYFLEAVLI